MLNWYWLDEESLSRQRERWHEADMYRLAHEACGGASPHARHSRPLLVWLGVRLEETGRRLQAR